MTHFKPDPAPEAGPGWYVSDETPIPRHEFTEANHLHSFLFDEDFPPTLDCPDDCGASCQPANLGELVDWALGHKCGGDEETSPAAAGTETTDGLRPVQPRR